MSASVPPSYTLVLLGKDLSEEHWHRKECISICFPPHILSLTHSTSICPFCVSGRCFKAWHKSTTFWVTFNLLFLCSVDAPCKARATENLQNQIVLIPRSSNVTLSSIKYPHEKLWNWVLDLAWTPGLHAFWLADILPLHRSKSLLVWLQQEAHSAISFHDIQWHLGVVTMSSVYLLLSFSQHFQSKIATNTYEKISTEVSEFTLDYWGQKVHSHRPLATWAANILLVFYPHVSVNAFAISNSMH